jgi:hypothetical protein
LRLRLRALPTARTDTTSGTALPARAMARAAAGASCARAARVSAASIQVENFARPGTQGRRAA